MGRIPALVRRGPFARTLVTLLAFQAWLEDRIRVLSASPLASDRAAALALAPILGIVSLVIGAVVGMAVLAALLGTYFSNVQSVVGTLSSATVGNASANALMPTFGLLAAFAAVFSIVGLIIVIVKVAKKA